MHKGHHNGSSGEAAPAGFPALSQMLQLTHHRAFCLLLSSATSTTPRYLRCPPKTSLQRTSHWLCDSPKPHQCIVSRRATSPTGLRSLRSLGAESLKGRITGNCPICHPIVSMFLRAQLLLESLLPCSPVFRGAFFPALLSSEGPSSLLSHLLSLYLLTSQRKREPKYLVRSHCLGE